MPTCGNCRQEAAFYEHSGLYYCSECDTQSQVMRVIEKDDDFEGTLNFSHSYSAAKKKRDTGKDKDVVPKKFWWSCELYQAIIKAQIKALLAMGFPAKLDEIVMQLWFRFLTKSGVAFCNSSLDDSLDDDMKEHEEGGSKVKFHSKDDWLHRREKADTTWGSRPKKYCVCLCQWDSVCFLFAGLRLMDEPVLLSDLIRWVRQGHLPLRSTSEVLPEHIAETMSVLDINRFCRTTMCILDVNSVFGLYHQLLVKLDLTPHPMSHEDFTFTIVRMVFSLNLPVELCSYTQRLYHKIQPALDENPVRFNPIVPECHALAYVIVALKLLFTLNDRVEHAISAQTRKLQSLFPTEINLFNWDIWVEAQKLRSRQCMSQEGSAQTFSDLLKINDMQNFVHHFKRFYQVEQVYKYLGMNKSARQDRLKEYQRPFRTLSREPSVLNRLKPSSLAIAVPQMKQTDSECSLHGSTSSKAHHEQCTSDSSTDWHSREYLLNEDFSKHILKHLTNLKELFEEHIIPPEFGSSVCDYFPLDERLPDRRDSVEEVDNVKTPFSGVQKSDIISKPIKRKQNSVNQTNSHKKHKKDPEKELHPRNAEISEDVGVKDTPNKTFYLSKGLRLKDQDVPYVTYPTISKLSAVTDINLKHQMDSFHTSMEWLLDWCTKLLEMNSKAHLVILVHNIEQTLFKK